MAMKFAPQSRGIFDTTGFQVEGQLRAGRSLLELLDLLEKPAFEFEKLDSGILDAH